MVNFQRGERTYDNPLYYKLASLHRSMRARCLNPKTASYKNYGGAGVTIADEWMKLRDFLDTIDQVEGYDETMILQGQLSLDKDTKYPGNKLYSPDRCRFISISENSAYKSGHQACLGKAPDGTIHEFGNRGAFAREMGLTESSINRCLAKQHHEHKGWVFKYRDDPTPFEDLYENPLMVGIDPNGNRHVFRKISWFAKEHRLGSPNITMVLQGKNRTHKGWRFYYQNSCESE